MGKVKKPANSTFTTRLFFVFSIITAAVFLPSTALLFIGMMPTIIALFTETSKKKIRVITVGAMNLAGCAPFLLQLWSKGHSFEKAILIVSDPTAIVVMYCAAVVGYLIDWSMAGIVAGIMYQRGLARQKLIKERQQALVERWGEEVTGQIPLDPQGFPLERNAGNRPKAG